MKAALRRRCAAILALVVATSGLTAVVGAPIASAAPTGLFDPGYIISDGIFYDRNTMGEAAIQAFLDQKGAACVPASDGTLCLKDYAMISGTKAADAYCSGYTAGSERVATIIARVALSCGVNPQALLVILQKEQSLVTRKTAGTAAIYQKAMGYGCPDTSVCDEKYYGLFNQVYMAARQFQVYKATAATRNYRAGRANTILYHPNEACGSSSVYIQNQATAGLYNYTPYQPNAAAIAAGTGTGDSCSSYGNRNFFNYFYDWFGSPTGNRQPLGNIDGTTTTAGSITVNGWAFDPDTTDPIHVHVYVDGVWSGDFAAGAARYDVLAAYPGVGLSHGFSATVGAAAGTHQVCAYGIDSSGGQNSTLACRSVTVVNKVPVGNFESLTASGTSVTLRGWAFDPDTTGAVQVHIYVDGAWGGTVTTDQPRADVAAAYKTGQNQGFVKTFTAGAGTHSVCAYAIDTTQSAVNAPMGCRTVVVAGAPANILPVANFEQLVANGNQVTLSGWALDPDTAGPVQVHYYVNGAWGGAVTTDRPRSDVAAAYHSGANQGFSKTFTAALGTQTVCAYAIDATSGGNTPMGCRTVTVVNRAPLGSVDSATVSGTTVTVQGWALDPDTTGPVQVHLYVDGAWGGAVTTDQARPDVGAAYHAGANQGFTTSFVAGAGSHSVCAFAIDTTSGPATPLPCRTVTVG
ncbi:hypothetical protein [Cellulomonas sp. URHB0016]